uniref:centromere protein T isoform X2 n=1 Tax=Jaculus jaculus TaxID=51337 RepID=UPI001E1B0137|nr:centromere protein T isoform X2 [Jaculus jaculus]
MADSPSPDSEPTTRTLLRRVLDTADVRSPRRRRSARNAIQRSVFETTSSRSLGSQTKTSVRRRSHGARSIGRLAHVQASAYLEKDTPRTLLKNILLTAPESSIMMPNPVVKLVPLSQVVQSYRRESSQGSLELQLPELDPPTTLGPGLPTSSRKKQRLRLSVFQQEVNQGLPLSQELPVNADSSSFTRSLNLTFTTPLQPQSVRRPGLARRPPTRRAVDVGALLQDLQDNSVASAPPVSRTDYATTSSPISELQPPLPEVTEAAGSEEAVRVKELEGSSEDEDTSGEPASPELATSTPELLQAKQSHEFLELPPPPGVGVLPSEPLEPVPARLPSRPRAAGPRPYRDPYRTGLSHYVKLFSFHAKMPMEKKAVEMVERCLDKYFQNLCNDLEVFAAHAGRKTVKPEDLELLLRRQGLVTDEVSMHVLVEQHLPMEYRQLLIPCAFSGNSVFPAH